MRKGHFVRSTSLLVLMAASAPAFGAVGFTRSGTAPTLGAADAFYLPGSVNEGDTINGDATSSGANDGSTYVAGDRPSKIVSFTTGSNALGYSLTAVTLQHVNWSTLTPNGTFYDVQPGDTLPVRFGTISGTTLSPTLTDTATYAGTGLGFASGTGTGEYFTFAFGTPQLLAANTQYFFELTSGTGSPFFELNSTSADGYAGGGAFTGNGANAVLDADNAVTALTGDYAFVASMTAVPEPASAAAVAGLAAFAARRRRRTV